MKSIDLVCMKKLDQKVNIIPIIAKADTISKTELQKFKSKIMAELQNNGVHIYEFPVDDETVSEINSSMNSHIPFAVIGSTDFVKVGSKVGCVVCGVVFKFNIFFAVCSWLEPGSIHGGLSKWKTRLTATL